MLHYHIRWSNSKLDWEAYPTSEEAQEQAEQLVRLGESYIIEQFDGECQQCRSLPNLATLPSGRFTRRDQKPTTNRQQPSANVPPNSWRDSVSESESQATRYERVLQSSVETRMRAIQVKLSLAFAFCSTVEIEIKYGHSDRAKALFHNLRSTVSALTDHINNPAHVSGKQSKEFREQLIQLQKRLLLLESRIEQR